MSTTAHETLAVSSDFRMCQHMSAYVSIRQHTSAYVNDCTRDTRGVVRLLYMPPHAAMYMSSYYYMYTGKPYYVNDSTRETRWDLPQAAPPGTYVSADVWCMYADVC